MVYQSIPCLYHGFTWIRPLSIFVRPRFLLWPSTGVRFLILSDVLQAPDPIYIFRMTVSCCPDQALTGVIVESRTTSPTQDFYYAGPLPIDSIKIYSCNVMSYFQYPIDIGATRFTGLQPQKRTGFTVSWVQRSG